MRSDPADETLLTQEAAESVQPYVPPRALAALMVGCTLLAVVYFVVVGLKQAHEGRARLAAQLLGVAPRDQLPTHFTLDTFQGARASIDDYPNKVVLLNFWATWCPPCVEEMPSMIRLNERLRENTKFVLLAVSADESWTPVRKFFSERPVPNFKLLLDPSGQIAKQYGTTMFPETYVLKNGHVIGFIEGPRDWDKWFAEDYLRALIDSGDS